VSGSHKISTIPKSLGIKYKMTFCYVGTEIRWPVAMSHRGLTSWERKEEKSRLPLNQHYPYAEFGYKRDIISLIVYSH
jgi:hypothetical protein